MKKLVIDEKRAKELYPTASVDLKTILEEAFGDESFFTGDMRDKVKSFEDACKITGDDPNDKKYSQGSSYCNAQERLVTITKALNMIGDKPWIPDYDDENEYKYFPWHYANKPGFRFYASYYTYALTYTSGGSQLCFRTRELSDYAGQQFINEYKALNF